MAIQRFEAEQVLSSQATLGEGPIWDPRYSAYWWVDIVEKKLFQFDPASQRNLSWQLDQMPGAVVARKSGGLMLALQHGFAGFDPESGQIEMFGDPESDQPDNRFNDGKCDPAGRFWAGTMRIDEHMKIFTGSLYSLESDRRVIKRLGGDIGVSNGIAWSKDATRMYFVDSPRRVIYQFDYDQTSGEIGNRTVVFTVPDEMGFPDGMTIDTNDKLWVAFWDGWCVAQICPTSSAVLAKVSLPVAAPTSCAFGGRDYRQLLITTASLGLSQDERLRQPLAGDLFVAEVHATGSQLPEFED